MIEHYFLVIEVPGGEELKFSECAASPKNFWGEAAKAVKQGNAKLICRRKDTGLSEEFRKHIKTVKTFRTYILVQMDLHKNEFTDKKSIFKKAARHIIKPDSEMVIDQADNFQLVTVDA
jgi:hypothetical protein